jgi:hypothetical protein
MDNGIYGLIGSKLSRLTSPKFTLLYLILIAYIEAHSHIIQFVIESTSSLSQSNSIKRLALIDIN